MRHVGDADSDPERRAARARSRARRARQRGGPKLTKENCAELIQAARHKSADQIRQLLADREPRPPVPPTVRKLAEPARPTSLPAAPPMQPPRTIAPPPPPRATEPLGAERYRVQFTADSETHEQLQELRALMRHQIPDGDVGKILARAISALLTQVRKQKFAGTSRPKTSRQSNEAPSRHIPAAIRRAVWQRDGGRCTYTSVEGRRCDSRAFIEFDHAEAWSFTRSHSVGEITLRCRAHNQLRARLEFGAQHMARFSRPTGFESSSPHAPPV